MPCDIARVFEMTNDVRLESPQSFLELVLIIQVERGIVMMFGLGQECLQFCRSRVLEIVSGS